MRGVAVTGRPSTEAITPHDSRESASFCGPSDIHQFTFLEDINFYFGALGEFGGQGKREFPQVTARCGSRTLEMTAKRFCYIPLPLIESELNGFVSIIVIVFHLCDNTGTRLSNCHRNEVPGLCKYLGHSQFFSQQSEHLIHPFALASYRAAYGAFAFRQWMRPLRRIRVLSQHSHPRANRASSARQRSAPSARLCQ